MNDQSDAGYRYTVPDIIKDRIQISDIYLQDSATSAAAYMIDLSFPQLRLYRTLKSREVSLLPGKVEAVLDIWEKKYLRHLQQETDRYRSAAVEQMNRDSQGRLDTLNSILSAVDSNLLSADWNRIQRRGVFRITPQELYGIPEVPRYILVDAEGRPADTQRLNQANRPDLEKTQSQFGTFTKMFRPGKVQDAVDKELQDWSKKRSDIGVTNAERRATLKQAQDIFDATKSMFEGERASASQVLGTVRAQYEQAIEDSEGQLGVSAVEEYCDLIMLAMEYPDEVCSNWLISYVPDRKALHVRLDLPTPEQLNIPKSWEYSTDVAEVVPHYFTDAELTDLCDSVSYQMCLRTIYDLFRADQAGAIESISLNGEMAVQNPGTDESASYVVMSLSVDKLAALGMDTGAEPRLVFEQFGGVTAGAPHLIMPVEPVGV